MSYDSLDIPASRPKIPLQPPRWQRARDRDDHLMLACVGWLVDLMCHFHFDVALTLIISRAAVRATAPSCTRQFTRLLASHTEIATGTASSSS